MLEIIRADDFTWNIRIPDAVRKMTDLWSRLSTFKFRSLTQAMFALSASSHPPRITTFQQNVVTA